MSCGCLQTIVNLKAEPNIYHVLSFKPATTTYFIIFFSGHSQPNSSTDSSIESSDSDEYDWSPAKTPPDRKPVNKENVLPGGWTLEELTNSPIKSFVPIWKQTDNEGFKAQFDKAKKRFERQQMKGKRKGKKKRKRKRKKSIKRKPAAKKMKLE